MTIENTAEKELIIKGLYRDRDELTARLNEVEKLIKKIKSNTFSLIQTPVIEDTQLLPANEVKQENIFPYKAEFKFQVLAIMDMIPSRCLRIFIIFSINKMKKFITGIV